MAFTKMNPQPAPRAPEMLEGDPNDPDAPYNQPAPGLYPGEVALQLGATANYAAVSVEPKRLENGAGAAVTAWARFIKADGETKLDSHGQHLETSFSHNFDMATAKLFGIRPLAKDVVLLVLGEPPVLKRDVPQDDGTTVQVPVLDVSEDVKLNVSLREAVLTARDTDPAPDTGAILGV